MRLLFRSLEQVERAVDAAGAAGQHDDRVGLLLRGRRHRRQEREPGEAEHPGEEKEGDQAPYHSIFLSAASSVWRAVKAASAIANSGSASKSAQPPGPSEAVAASPAVTSDHCQPMSSRIAAATAVPSRSEEHTSELQSLMRISYDVFCLKKK